MDYLIVKYFIAGGIHVDILSLEFNRALYTILMYLDTIHFLELPQSKLTVGE